MDVTTRVSQHGGTIAHLALKYTANFAAADLDGFEIYANYV
ncbi:hypothetical protein U370_02600 [Anaplasma marginale str. Dawn]|nr:hypothetical protein U128_02650 [Anaplasma marginale str. Gypsy Plains]AGZ80119.1 hypothetical protein U370_02600 [Anaplasma marginale str. Dawn]